MAVGALLPSRCVNWELLNSFSSDVACLFSKQKMEFKGKSATTVIFLMVMSVCIPLEMLNMVCNVMPVV